MKLFWCFVLVLFFNAVNATFWYNNDDFGRSMGSYKNNLPQDYLRALSIFKRKMQLLGFFPIVINDNELEYVSMDSYLAEDDDDRIYKLLKDVKKERKAKKKLQKKKTKKTKKDSTPSEPTTTTVQPISNIVYYWPSAITTIIHPSGENEGTSTYKQSFDSKFDFNESSEDSSSEVDSQVSYDRKNEKNKPKPARINYETSFSIERKLNSADDEGTDARSIGSQTSINPTHSVSTTTPYPLLTIFPDPEEVAIQEILDQQEIVNKMTDSGVTNQQNIRTTNADDDHGDHTTVELLNAQKNSSEAQELPPVTVEEIPVYESSPSQGPATYENTSEENVTYESTTSDVDSINVTEPSTTESSVNIPSGALQFFHETLPDEQSSPIEIVDNISIPNSADARISDQIAEITENHRNIDGHRETDTQRNHSTVPSPLNEETTTTESLLEEHSLTPTTTVYLPAPGSSDDKLSTASETTIPTLEKTNEPAAEGFQYTLDPRISENTENTDEARSITDKSTMVAVILENSKSGRRSDVPIEADDRNDEDTTDNLAYNLTGENVLQQSNVIENTSAETSTPSPPPARPSADNIDLDQFGSEIIPLIPIIIKQMKQGNVSPEEMEILKNTYGPFWPFIVEEASRESDSSEEMNPLLSEILNPTRHRSKREAKATVGRWRRPIYGRRIYIDDDDGEFVPRRTYYGRRRRPTITFY